MAARPDPAPTSSTRPEPDVRNPSVGSTIGRLSIKFRITTAPAAHKATRTIGMYAQRDQDRQTARPASPAARTSGTSIA